MGGRARPPYSLGQVSPIQPLAETFLVNAVAKVQKSSSSHHSVDFSQRAGSSVSRKSLTSSRHSFCSAVSCSSMASPALGYL